MSFILGFGITEENERAKIKEVLTEVGRKGENLNAVLDKGWNLKAKEYDKMPRETAPERYTTVHYYDNKLVFLHINRRHAFSPDGWAALTVEEDFVIRNSEGESISCNA